MFKRFFEYIKGKKYEYLYIYTLGTDLFSSEQYKFIIKDIYILIDKDLKSISKKIIGVDFYNDTKEFETTVILTSKDIQSVIYKPLIYEIYAYIKKSREINVLTYKYKILKFEFDFIKNKEEKVIEKREIEILKLKVEC